MFKLNKHVFIAAMVKKGFNPIDLAKEASLSPATVTKILQTNTIYSFRALRKIAKALDVEAVTLVKD